MYRIRLWIALLFVLLMIVPAWAAPAPQLGFYTRTLTGFDSIPLVLNANGSILVYKQSIENEDGIQLFDLTLNQKLDFIPTSVISNISINNDTLAWVDSSNTIYTYAIKSKQTTVFNINPLRFVLNIELTPDFIVFQSWTDSNVGPPNYSDVYLLDRQTGTITLIDDYTARVNAAGDWVILEKPSDGVQLIAYNTKTHERFTIDTPRYFGPVSIDPMTASIAYTVDLNTPIVIYDLINRTRSTIPATISDLSSKIVLTGDFVAISTKLDLNTSKLLLYQRSNGLELTKSWRTDINNNWEFVLNPEPTLIWADFYTIDWSNSAGYLRATTFVTVQPPSAMEPETPSGVPNNQFFDTTQHNVSPPLSTYWNQNGGLAQFGYPLSARFDERNLDTNTTYPTQYFERQRFEWHQELAGTAYEILLGRLGDEVLINQGRNWRDEGHDQPWAVQLPGACQTFATTERTVCGPFLDYWRSHGLDLRQKGISYEESLALFGLPLTAPRYELNPDGDLVITQWFERARFEYHPTNPAPYDVLLGRLGAEILSNRGWSPSR